MAKKSREPSFAELLQQPTWRETTARSTGEHAVRPGAYNAAGDLFDPEGRLLAPLQDDVTPDEARRLVLGGALVAYEGCGCGGGGGCQPQWLATETLRALRSVPAPRLVGRGGTPSWIELWAGEGSQVVHVHGDVRWADALG